MGAGVRYRAFFSYSRADDRIANWLHGQLDRYRTPKAFVGAEGALGRIPAKLYPIFRDRTDLSSGGHVNAELQAALESSETLVVLCSPSAAKSFWVNHEVETFVRLGRQERIFPVIASGEPNSNDPATECFPPALRELGILAADLRQIKTKTGQVIGDGRNAARLKLIAGLLGLPLDELVRREQQRQRQTATIFGGIASAVAAIFIGLSAYIFSQNVNLEHAKSIISDQAAKVEKEAVQLADALKRAIIAQKLAETNQKLAEKNAQESERQKRLAEQHLAQAADFRAQVFAELSETLAKEGRGAEALLMAVHADPASDRDPIVRAQRPKGLARLIHGGVILGWRM